MAIRSPAISYADLAAALLSSSEVLPRARLIAQQVAQFLPNGAVVVYGLDENSMWAPRATEGEVAFSEPLIEFEAGTLGIMGKKREPVVFSGRELARESYAHLNIRRTLVSLAALPLLVDDNLVGGIELLSFTEPITPAQIQPLADLLRLAALGMATGAAYENERNSQLESITRITQMYDLEKVFNSTMEMDELLTTIVTKFQEIMSVQAVNLWLVDGDAVTLMSQAGLEPTAEIGSSQKPGGGIAGDLSDSGEPVLIDNPEDERLAKRNAGVEEGAVFSLVAAPILSQESLVGVVEAINRTDGVPFDEDDQFLLTTVCETASNALHNASLLLAERKVEILETLVQVSREITSTLNIERVVKAIVNGPQAVIPYERAAIALEQTGKLRLRAVSGMNEVAPNDPQVKPLDQILHWAAEMGEEIDIRQHDGEITETREETRAKFHEYFAETGANAFYALPLVDDQGRVGILSFESSDPDFLSEAHLEMIKVLAAQATVALRNAQLYREVPFIGLLEPVLERKRKFLALPKQRRTTLLALTAAAALFLAVFPLPMRLSGDATVSPAATAQIMPEVEGVVRSVYVREGQPVTRGTILADLEDWDYRAKLAAAQAKYETAASEMNRALATNDGAEAGIQKVQADFWRAEVARAQQRLDRTHLRSPIDGVVATAHIENLVGRRLEYGDSFAQVVDTSRADVDVAIEEQEAALLRQGQRAAVKVDALPVQTFHGQVTVVSPMSEASGDRRVFFARVAVSNPQGALRSGMQGRGKVTAGWYPAGYVLFRGSAQWAWSKLWGWFGW